MLLQVLKVLPAWLCLGLCRPITFVFYLLAGVQRRAVQENLKALRPQFSAPRRWWAGFQVFDQFALTYLDRLWHMHFGQAVRWEVPNLERFEEMESMPGGLIVFTLHSGNYDIGASLFSQKFDRPIHIVRVPERTEDLQKLRADELRREEKRNPNLHVHYNEVDSHLGLELCRLLMKGEVVAVQGDRVVTGISPIAMDHDGIRWQIPRGPLVLAEISKVPCYPIFLYRLGRLHYHIELGEPIYDGKTKKRADDIGRDWLPVMARFVDAHWDQWFVFEKLLTRNEPS